MPWLGPPLLRARVAKRKVIVRLRSDSLVRAGVEIKLRGASRIRPHHNLHAIDATPAHWLISTQVRAVPTDAANCLFRVRLATNPRPALARAYLSKTKRRKLLRG